MSKKLKKLQALQQHIDSQFMVEKDESQQDIKQTTQRDDKSVKQLDGNQTFQQPNEMISQQANDTEIKIPSAIAANGDFLPVEQQVSNPTSQQAVETLTPQNNKPINLLNNKTVNKQNSKQLTQQVGKPASTKKDLIDTTKKTFYIEQDIAEILKFIKFSVKKDESKFVNQALQVAINDLLGSNWRKKFQEYLNK